MTGEAVKKIIPFDQNPKETIPSDPEPPGYLADNLEVEISYLAKEVRADGDAIDQAGQAVVSLLQEAAEKANADCDRAMDLVQKLSAQLRAAEKRIPELELEMRDYQDRAQRAEQWMARIRNDIEQTFFKRAPPAAERAR